MPSLIPLKVLDPDDKAKTCDLILKLCFTLLQVPDTRRIIEIEAPAAFALAESIGDASRAALACGHVLTANLAERGLVVTPEINQWIERYDRYARPDTTERVSADAWLGVFKFARGDTFEGGRLITKGLDLARRLDNQRALLSVIGTFLMFRSAPQHTAERLHLAEEYRGSL